MVLGWVAWTGEFDAEAERRSPPLSVPAQHLTFTAAGRSVRLFQFPNRCHELDLRTGRTLASATLPTDFVTAPYFDRASSAVAYTTYESSFTFRAQSSLHSPTAVAASHPELSETIWTCPLFGNPLRVVAVNTGISLWSWEHPARCLQRRELQGKVERVALSPDRAYLAVGLHASGVEVWRLSDLSLVTRHPVKDVTPKFLEWSSDSRSVLIAGLEGSLESFTISSGDVWIVDDPLRTQSISAAIASRLSVLVIGSLDGRVVIYPRSRQAAADDVVLRSDEVRLSSPARCLRISEDGTRLLAGLFDGSVQCWDLASRRLVWFTDSL